MSTERHFLDLIYARYAKVKSLGDAPRYLVAEHPRTPLGDSKNMRVLDCIILDRHKFYPNGRYVRDENGRVSTVWDHVPFFPVMGFEVKTSRSDWLRELKDPSKSEAWRRYCTHFYVVAPRGVVNKDELPAGWGLILPRGSGLAINVHSEINVNPEPMPTEVVTAITYAAMKTDRVHRN